MRLDTDYGAFVRYGLVIFGLSGFLFAAGDAAIPLEGAMFAPVERPDAFATLVTSPEFLFWSVRGLVGVHMELIGANALWGAAYLWMAAASWKRFA